MNRRHFLAATLAAIPALVIGAPATEGAWVYIGPYIDMGCLDMHIYASVDRRSYALLTYHRYYDGQIYEGPFPGIDWDGPYTDMEWVEMFYPDVRSVSHSEGNTP